MMKELAAGFLLAIILLTMLVGALWLPAWTLERSPNTGICYEVVTRNAGFYVVKDSHPVDSSYCEETP